MSSRQALDVHRSGAHARPSTTYLYLANTGEVGHRSKVRKGVVWWWGEGGEPILGFPLKLFWEKYPAGVTYHPKEANMSWNH